MQKMYLKRSHLQKLFSCPFSILVRKKYFQFHHEEMISSVFNVEWSIKLSYISSKKRNLESDILSLQKAFSCFSKYVRMTASDSMMEFLISISCYLEEACFVPKVYHKAQIHQGILCFIKSLISRFHSKRTVNPLMPGCNKKVTHT